MHFHVKFFSTECIRAISKRVSDLEELRGTFRKNKAIRIRPKYRQKIHLLFHFQVGENRKRG